MRWDITTEKAPKKGQWRRCTVFAWWPVTIDNKRVWLEKVTLEECYIDIDVWGTLDWVKQYYYTIEPKEWL